MEPEQTNQIGTMESERYAEIAVNAPVNRIFTYSVPTTMNLKVGSIVEVRFGNRKLHGSVVLLKEELSKDLASVRIQPVLTHLTPGFYIGEDLIELGCWVADYYMCSPGEALATVSFIGLNHVNDSEITRITITQEGLNALNGPARLGIKQRAVLAMLTEQNSALTTTEVNAALNATASTIQSLKKRGWIHEERIRQVRHDDYSNSDPGNEIPPQLNPEQEVAFKECLSALNSNKPKTVLLHGITGSGKTEVYLQAIQEALNRGGQAICLVPEISLTPQTVSRFRRRFGTRVGVYHSRLKPGQKLDLWRQIMDGQVEILVGARSAVFAPFNNLKIIVVDEEHESSYKQDVAPRYHARDVAIMRAQSTKALVILGSATPTIETYYKALQNRFQLLELHKRASAAHLAPVLPPIEVVDMNLAIRDLDTHDILSPDLETIIEEALARKEQVLIFINRRGFFTLVSCLDCKEPVKCRACDVSLTYHKARHLLICHYCTREYVVPTVCPSCESVEIKAIGYGTQRLDEILEQRFPSARRMRMDLDTTSSRLAFLHAWEKIEKGEVDIIVGTQMITKGIHLEKVTVVGVPHADVSFYQPDFRAAERSFSLLTQVAGRAGRGALPGRVIVQTFTPHFYALQFARNHDYVGFYEKEIRVRYVLKFPPFYRLIGLLITGRDEEKTMELARDLYDRLDYVARRGVEEVLVTNAQPAPISRINEEYRWRIILRSQSYKHAREILAEGLAAFGKIKGSTAVHVAIDVDPHDLL